MLSAQEAHQILNAICTAIIGKSASSHKNPENYTRDEAAFYPEWWHDSPDPESPFNSKRYEAYLRAYLAIGGDQIVAVGIPLRDGKYLRPDKGVMKALLVYGLVILDQGIFYLTDRGRSYLGGIGQEG